MTIKGTVLAQLTLIGSRILERTNKATSSTRDAKTTAMKIEMKFRQVATHEHIGKHEKRIGDCFVHFSGYNIAITVRIQSKYLVLVYPNAFHYCSIPLPQPFHKY